LTLAIPHCNPNSRQSLLTRAAIGFCLGLLASNLSQAANVHGAVSDDPVRFAKILLVSERDKPVMMYCYVDMAIYKNSRSSFCIAARDEINKTAVEFGFDPIKQEDARSLFECTNEIFRQLSDRRKKDGD